MYKGTNEITNKDLGFKLTNSTSSGESVFSAGYIQKTVKADLQVRVNYVIPPRNQRGKVSEDSRGLHTEARGEALPCGAAPAPPADRPAPVGPTCHPRCYISFPPSLRMHLCCSLSRFDPRAQVTSSGLYNRELLP
jgi:hypothetical protein